jgi:hypothetical protein
MERTAVNCCPWSQQRPRKRDPNRTSPAMHRRPERFLTVCRRFESCRGHCRGTRWPAVIHRPTSMLDPSKPVVTASSACLQGRRAGRSSLGSTWTWGWRFIPQSNSLIGCAVSIFGDYQQPRGRDPRAGCTPLRRTGAGRMDSRPTRTRRASGGRLGRGSGRRQRVAGRPVRRPWCSSRQHGHRAGRGPHRRG